ncbi:MAG: universal stress protein [Cyclobacteriaceae bacterium]
MNRLLVPVDFSEQSIHALGFALRIAEQSGGTVALLHVITLPHLHHSPLIPLAAFKEHLVSELSVAVEEKFTRLTKEFNKDGVKIQTHVAHGGIHTNILHFIESEKIDLVVMGTKGASGMKEWMIGSNTEKVVRASPVPVLAVKNSPNGHPIKHIVFPNALDTERQEGLIMRVKALQNFFHATLHIIWVNTPAFHKPDTEVRKQLTAFADRFMLKDYTINVFNYSNEEAGILEFTRQLNGDLIAMGTHGLRGIAHLFTGSVAEDVVNHVRYPVWTYCTKTAEKLSDHKEERG